MTRFIIAALAGLALVPAISSAQLRAASVSDAFVTRLCEVYTRGDMYCRNVDQLLENEWRTIDPAALQAAFRKVYEDRGLNQRHNGLMSCGSGTYAAAPQSRGAMPTSQDIAAGRSSCLKELEKRMGSFGGAGRGRGRGGVFGGAPWNPGSGGGSSWTGTTCTGAGDPTRGQATGPGAAGSGDLSDHVVPLTESTYREARRDWYLKDEEKWTNEAKKTTDADERALYESMAEDARKAAMKEEYLRRAAKRAEEAAAGGSGSSEGRTGTGSSTCQEVDQAVRDFLDECNRNGWTSYDCQKMKACSDPAVTDPNPGGPAVTSAGTRAAGQSRGDDVGMRCGDVPIFGDDDLRRATQEYCDERTQFDPDGGGRCTPFNSTGSTVVVMPQGCGLRALTENGCPATVNAGSVFPSFRRSFQQELVLAQKKLGGPLVVIPVRNPTSPRGPVGPRPAGGRPNSSE